MSTNILHPMKEKYDYHDRISIAAWNYEIQKMSFIPLPFYVTQIITNFLNSRILANQDKVEGYSANCEILIKGIVSLL